jgi:hypothetical protein
MNPAKRTQTPNGGRGEYTELFVGVCVMVALITLVEIAQQQSVRLKRDKCHEEVVHGKLGLLYDHDASRFGMVFEASAKSRRFGNTLRFRKRRAIASRFSLHQEGHFEAILLFDPSDAKQARLAIRLIQAKKIKHAPRPSDTQLRARALFSFRARSKRQSFGPNTNAIAG